MTGKYINKMRQAYEKQAIWKQYIKEVFPENMLHSCKTTQKKSFNKW